MTHPARRLSFDDIEAMMEAAKADGLVNERIGSDGLRLYCYTRNAVCDRVWTPATMMARGLILDAEERRVVATPFEKFFNLGEAGDAIPNLPLEVFEKVDGSLIVVFWHRGRWQTATKGSLQSDQAKWAADQLARTDLRALVPGTTYLAEAAYPENRIVVRYDETGLVLLGAHDERGVELNYDELHMVGAATGWRVARSHSFSSISDMIEWARFMPAGGVTGGEGFVIRFSNGLRLKVKGDEYRRLHALIHNITPLGIWEVMKAGDSLVDLRRQIPEEFWDDFDAIREALYGRCNALYSSTQDHADRVSHLSDKEVGLQLASFPPEVRGFIFPYRKNGSLMTGRTREPFFRSIRPTGNRLDGYTPSYAMSRVLEEAA